MLVLGVLCFESYIKRRRRPLKLMGDASYSIFLTHMLWLAPATLLFARLDIRSHWEQFFLMVPVAMAMSLLFHWWVERPLLSWLRTRRRAVPDAPAGVIGTDDSQAIAEIGQGIRESRSGGS
jgi:exopolysaccharide production protein ExoZ